MSKASSVSRQKSPGLLAALQAVGNSMTTLADRIRALSPERSITVQAISQWEYIPLDRVAVVAQATGVPKHVLRPDHFDRPPTLDEILESARPSSSSSSTEAQGV